MNPTAATTTVSGNSDLHMSDVIDVIINDPDYADQQTPSSFSVSSRTFPVLTTSDSNPTAKQKPCLKILEQPASKALRFRYECEGRLAGSIPGASSSNDNKTFPTVQITGYRGRAVVVVSCVTKDPPYRPHPHSLVGKDGCKKGVCTVEINSENMVYAFSNLGIQCVKKKGIDEALKLREEIKLDPFRTGFAHRLQPQNIDLNAVRLCFQAFIEGSQKGKCTVPLKPVVSDPIYDKKAMNDLVICKLSHFSSPVSGKAEIILLCDKVTKEDIQIRFYEEKDGRILWEGLGEFQACDVHKQVAITFRTPPYKTLDVTSPVQTYIQLRRPSDKMTSESRPFLYTPVESGIDGLRRKRTRPNNQLLEAIVREASAAADPNQFFSLDMPLNVPVADKKVPSPRPTKQGTRTRIKKEPADVVNPGMLDISYALSSVSSPESSFLFAELSRPNSGIAGPFIPLHNPEQMLMDNPSNYPTSQNNLSNAPETSLIDMESLNVDQHQDVYLNALDTHLFENLSLTDIGEPAVKVINTEPSLDTVNRVQTVELPILTLSGLLNSADLLDSAENLAKSTIREIEALNALQGGP